VRVPRLRLESPSVRWRTLAIVYAVLLSAAAGFWLLHVPFTVSEVALNLLQHQSGPPAVQVFIDTIGAQTGNGRGYLRGFSIATGTLLFELSGGEYFLTYRSFHVALISVLLLTLVYLVRVDSLLSFGVAMLSATALLGIHTFHEAVYETETNIKLIIPACLFVTVCLSASQPARWKDAAAILMAFYAFFSNELGLLVWVCVVAGYLVGFRGVSRSAVIVVSVLLLVYLYLRFVHWGVGTPPLTERSSGFGFRRYDPVDLIRMFGRNPYPFYIYNVVVSGLTVLFAEPRFGTFTFIRSLAAPEYRFSPGLALEFVSSTLTTLVMVWYVARRARRWIAGDIDYGDKLFLVAVAVVAANAAISFPYAKEVTMSSAGAFYALAMFPVLRYFMTYAGSGYRSTSRAVATFALLAVISVTWTVRAGSFFLDLRRQAYRAQTEWAVLYDWMAEQHVKAPPGRGRELLDRLRREALRMDVPRVYNDPGWIKALDPMH
jgi:hypothetical protein